jgi:predicted kinase
MPASAVTCNRPTLIKLLPDRASAPAPTRDREATRHGNGVRRPLVILVSGLPGTGKTTLAAGLGQRIGAVTLSRDQARQEIENPLVLLYRCFTRLFGSYRRELQEEANRRLEMAVAEELVAGRPVVVEVVADRVIRHRVHELAAHHGVPVRSIEVTCSGTAQLARRLSGRPGDWTRIVARMSKSYEPWPTALVVDSCDTSPSEMVEQAVAFICGEERSPVCGRRSAARLRDIPPGSHRPPPGPRCTRRSRSPRQASGVSRRVRGRRL